MTFADPGTVLAVIDRDRAVLSEALVYDGAVDRWTVPAGFGTDFASVPRLLTWLVPRMGAWTRAAILHDWFCTVGIVAGVISARDADGVFRRVLREEGTPVVLRWLMWTAVRLGAAGNPVRRAGWWRDAPLVLAIALPLAVLLGPVVVLLELVTLVYSLAELLALACGGLRGRS